MKKPALLISFLVIAAIMLLVGCNDGREASTTSAGIGVPGRTSIMITNLPAGASVYIDGTKATGENDSFEVAAGSHTLEVRMAGYAQHAPDPDAAIEVSAGQSKQIQVQLLALTPPTLPGI